MSSLHDFKPDIGDLHIHAPITRWDEALPLGNGFCGALIWGPSQGLRFSLDRSDLWDATACSAIHDPDYHYSNMVRLARAGQEDEIRRIFDAPYQHPLPSKLPAGKLIFHFDADLPQESHLSITEAEACIHLGEATVHGFVHAQKHLGMIRICSRADAFRMEIENPSFGLYTGGETEILSDSVDTASLQQLHYPPAKIGAGWFTQEIGGNMEYGIFTQTRRQHGAVEVAWCIASSADGADWKEAAREMLSFALDNGYEQEKKLHADWWARYWQQSGMELPDSEFCHNWYLTQYLFASCSRKGCYPMPLQGVWTADDGKLPPWKGDYHHDLNTELSYCSYLKAGHFDEGESFLDYLWNMRNCAKEFARSFYHARGICLPGTMTQNGDSLGGWGMYSLSPTNQLWLCRSFEQHWHFTGDHDFLVTRAYPYLQESAAFLLDLLEERDGLYYLPVSSSPEIHDDTLAAFLTPNSNYDLALMRWLFTALAAMSEAVGDGKQGQWMDHLSRLPQLAVSPEGILKLSPDELLPHSHRHFSHAMAIYPLGLLSYEADKPIIDATILQLEQLGTGFWVGYSFCWMANLYAVQGNGNAARMQLQHFWKGFCSPNGFHLNGDYQNLGLSSFHYRPFTLEANFFAADALQEMLLKTQGNRVTLFPAIPSDWDSAAFSGFRGEMGLRVSARLRHKAITYLEISAAAEQTVWLRAYPGLGALLGRPAENGWFKLAFSAGTTCIFEA